MLRKYINLPLTVHVLCLGTFVNRAGTFIIPFLTLYVTDGLGVSKEYAPLSLGAFGVGSLFGSLVGGQLADRIGRRPVLLIALLGGAALLIGLSLIRDPYLFVAGIFAFALVGEMYRPAAFAMLADVTTPRERPLAYSLSYFATNLGFAVGPALGGIIAERFSFSWLFWGDAATCALYALILFVWTRETLGRPAPVERAIAHDANTADEVAHESEPAASAESAPEASLKEATLHILRDTTFLALTTGALCTALLFIQSMATLPLYLDELGLSKEQYGRIIALNGVLIVALQLPLTSLLQSARRSRVLVLGALLMAEGFALKALALTELQFMGTIVVWTIAEMMLWPMIPPIVAELSPQNMRGRYMAVLGISFSGASMLGAPLGGLALASLGGFAFWLSSSSLALLAGLLFFLVREPLDALREEA